MDPVAAIDLGTNSIRLLITQQVDGESEDLTLVDLVRRMEIVRLGQGVDRTGAFAPEALERTFAALREFATVIDAHGVERSSAGVRMVATSASRDVSNRDQLIRGVRDILGVDPEVITGEEEAELTFLGATAELEATHDFQRPFLVVDIGGGSTEFVLGQHSDDADTIVRASRSVNIGCVRMTERHLREDPPSAAEIAAATADVDAALDEVSQVVPLGEARTVVCVAGTATTVAGIALDLPAYDPEEIHHARVSVDRTRSIAEELLAMPRDQRAALGVMHPGRVDVIGAGALILQRTVERTKAGEFVASEHDILDGVAFSLLHV
ncbi:Ppx/GppA phosphatase family protein [Spiractinospora alimapuensis]|uniref:Ppx/GppA phosphatase family protein n=1 Tax=Spiractinospora alimapuensis TaxID=2820884 RepID=UPI002ED49F50